MKYSKNLLVCLILGCLILVLGCDNPDALSDRGPAERPAAKLTEVTLDTYESLVKQNELPVLLDFWAPWCGPCVALTPRLEELAAKYDGQIEILKVNVDNNPELSEQYKITTIPRLVYLIDGEVVIEDGSSSLSDIEDDIQQVIANK